MKTIKLIQQFSIIILLTFLVTASTQAQNKKGTKGSGSITGTVMDKETSSPVESATIQLLKMQDSSLVNGAASDADGNFSITAPYGKYKLVITYISYNTVVLNGITINSQTPSKNVGVINLSTNSITTDVIEVEAEKEFMEVTADKKIFNVDKDIVSTGGTATDVLKNIPSVTVDADGNVSLRGSTNVKFLVNGKPSGMIGTDPTNSLQQISASTIERIEVIDNPSAKYDPEGMSGIINIVLKKPDESGYNGIVTVNGGTGDKINTSANLNYKTKNFNLYGNYSFRLFNMDAASNSFRQNSFGDSLFYFNQNASQSFEMNGQMGTVGIDYYLDKKNTLSLSGTYNYRKRSVDQNLLFKNLDAGENLTSQYIRDNTENHTGNVFDVTLDYTHAFDKPKQQLSSTFYFSNTSDDEVLNINQQNYSVSGIPLNNPILQNTYTNGKYNIGSFQVDYYHPLGDPKSDSRIELGYKGQLRNTSSDFTSETFDYNQNQFITDNSLSNSFEYKEDLQSLYGLLANNYKDFKYQFGIRLEEAITSSDLITSNRTFDNNYFSIFPSAFLSQKFLNTNEIQLNYSRRINRPSLYMLNPFVDYSDPYNLRQGNPYLKPEYVNSLQLNYVKYFDFATVTSSIFFRQINDMMTRISTVYPDGVSLTTFENLNSAKSYGVELTTTAHPYNWWNLNADFTYFRMIINGNDPNAALNNDNYSYTAKLTSNFKVFNLFDLQVSYNYQGPTVLAQGRMDPVQSFDIAVKKNVLNNRGSIGLRISDPFNQLKYTSETSGPGFVQDMTRTRDSRVVFLTLSYRFGTDGTSKPKKPKPPTEETNPDEMDN